MQTPQQLPETYKELPLNSISTTRRMPLNGQSILLFYGYSQIIGTYLSHPSENDYDISPIAHVGITKIGDSLSLLLDGHLLIVLAWIPWLYAWVAVCKAIFSFHIPAKWWLRGSVACTGCLLLFNIAAHGFSIGAGLFTGPVDYWLLQIACVIIVVINFMRYRKAQATVISKE